MLIEFKVRDVSLIVIMKGEIDHHIAESIRTRIDREFSLKGVKNIIFDFGQVHFMDSSGIGVIMGRYKKVKELGGKVSLCNIQTQLDRVFTLSGVYKIIQKYDTVDQAVASGN